MSNAERSGLVTRRTAIQGMAVGAAGIASVAGSPGTGLAKDRAPSGKAKQPERGCALRIERQPTGAEIWQVTTEEYKQSNIYCEVPYCSVDSRYFVYERRNPKLTGKNKVEFMAVELGTWKQHRVDSTIGLAGSAIMLDGTFYYLKRVGKEKFDLMRVDLAKGSPEKVHRIEGEPTPRSLGTVSADKRYYATGKLLAKDYTMFGILLIDLKTGAKTIADRDPYILNPHPQFEPGESKLLMVQHNRGGKYTPQGKRIRLVGPEGATLYVLSVADGKRTTLEIGTPYTTPVTGHEAWIGTTKELLLSVSAGGDYAPEKGNLLGVRPGKPARVVSRGYKFNHVGVSQCGRFFCCDDWQGTFKIVIGSTKTGKSAVLCESKTKVGRAQNTHPHAYLTPDLKWVIFNSNRSGFAHVYAASVPDGMIAELSKG